MFFQILIAIILGTIIGTFTGLIPGIHVNLVAVIALSIAPLLLKFTSPLIIAIFIISVAVTHTFLDFLPSCFLGAPEVDTALSVLPAHRLLLKGRGYEAVKLTVVGSLFSLILIIALTPFFLVILKTVYTILENFIAYILIIAVLFLILKDKSRFYSLILFLMSGVLGLAVLNITTLKQPLLPLLSGLFGISTLFFSISQKVRIPKQRLTQMEIKPKITGKALTSSLVSGSICCFLPGIGPAEAAILGSQISGDIGTNGFLILVGGLNTINIVLSFITLYAIDKARNGAIVVVSKILQNFSFNYLLLFLGSALVVAAIATFLALSLGKIFSKIITKINYQLLCIFIIILVSLIVFIFSGFLGLFVLIVSASVGLLSTLLGTGKNHLMGCLVLPVILYFLL